MGPNKDVERRKKRETVMKWDNETAIVALSDSRREWFLAYFTDKFDLPSLFSLISSGADAANADIIL